MSDRFTRAQQARIEHPITRREQQGHEDYQPHQEQTCPDCQGFGYTEGHTICPTCQGYGRTRKEQDNG